MQKIRPFLWFDGQGEEAAKYYVSIFKNASIDDVARYGDVGPGQAGAVMFVTFTLDGQEFMALNGGPEFTFSSAISFFVDCKDQAEVDHYWEKLSAGGETVQCGWLKDKYGVTWQIVPTILGELLGDEDREKSDRVMQAMMKMIKLDVAALQRAYDGD